MNDFLDRPASVKPGSTLGQYEIVSLLGKGGMGEVWRARDTILGRQVAVKILPPEFAEDPERLPRFEREAKLLASLSHPNIAVIHSLEDHEGLHFLVLELIEGDTLADRIRRGPIPFEESLRLASQIAEAIEAAHEAGIIHRDLKPANIKITPDGKVKVLDFGLAKVFVGGEDAVDLSNSPTLSMQGTGQGVILGTAAYMSPEQAKGRTVDERADIWAFGAVLYEMLTGRPAFGGDEVSEILASVLAREPDYALLPADIGPGVQRLLRRCLQRDPGRRWRDAGDVRIEIEESLSDPSGPLVEPVRTAQPARRSNLPWVAAISLAAISGLAVWALVTEPPARTIRFTHLLPEDQRFSNVDRPAVAVSGDGSMLVYAANNQLWMRRIDALEATPIPGTEGATGQFFSPDGQWIGYWTNTQLRKIAIGGGNPISLAEGGSPLGGSSWSADGRIMWGRPDGIWTVSDSGGTSELLIENWGEERLNDPQLLPDGQSVLFDRGDPPAQEVWVQSPESGEPKYLFPGSAPRYVPTGHIVYELASVLYAVPFDPASFEVTGGAVSLDPLPFSSRYDLSDSGVLVYAPGSRGGGEAQLAMVDRGGAVLPLGLDEARYLSPRVSPSGDQLAVEIVGAGGQSDIWVLDLTGASEPRNLTTGEGNHTRPIWGPDEGSVTYFSSGRADASGMFWKRADGSGVEQRVTTEDDGLFQRPGAWHPDGEVVTFATVAIGGGRTGIWTYRMGADAQDLYTDDRLAGLPDFSPDGNWIAYRSNDGNGFSVFVRGFPNAESVTEVGSGEQPAWARSGRELFLGFMRSVDITTEPSIGWNNNLDVPVPGLMLVPGARNWDVMPDGERFVAVLGSGGLGAQPRINVVVNWIDELKERVPVAVRAGQDELKRGTATAASHVIGSALLPAPYRLYRLPLSSARKAWSLYAEGHMAGSLGGPR